MSTKPENENLELRTIKTFADGLGRDFAVISEINKGSASRLVWFVAISGFALLNIDPLASRIVGTEFSGIRLLVLIIPWALSGLLGVVAHWLLGETTAKDNEYYIMKQHSLRSFLATAPAKPSINQVLDILNIDETDNEVATRLESVSKIAPWATRLERATFILLIFSFAWSIIYPLVLLVS